MTNKEAIAELKAMPIIYPITNGENDRASRLMQARDMAIKALKQEPCEDAISRQAVLDMMQMRVSGKELYKAVYDLPPVNPQPKTGYWIKIKSGDKDFSESIVCSRCGNENSHLDFNENAEPIGKVFVTSKFCPNCGIRMVNPQERSGEE